MPCYFPLQAFQSKRKKSNGKSHIIFSDTPDLSRYDPIALPCGGCVGCRLERSRQWAIRCLHESRLYEQNCFITLTFSPESLAAREVPESLDVRDFQLFMKRLRKRFGPKIRFFHCGEYGEQYGRPHYHACIFNFDFPDKKFWKMVNNLPLYTSEILEELWPHGFCSIGAVTFESAAYVARYIMKKINGEDAFAHYNEIDEDTGEILLTRKPEYVTMSRRPGIGKDFFEQYWRDFYINGNDSVVLRGRKVRPPKYYDTQYEVAHPEDFQRIKSKRKSLAVLNQSDSTPERLSVRHKVKLAAIKKLPRKVE